MRRRFSGLCALACVLSSGCADDENRSSFSPSRALDGSVDMPLPHRDSGSSFDGAGPDTPPTLASASPSACAAEPLDAEGAACGAPDPAEPSSRLMPARLNIDDRCNVVRAWAADKEDDAYRFTIARSDPVQIELSYATSARAELSLTVLDGAQRKVAGTSSDDAAPVERQQAVYAGTAGMTYDVQLDAQLVGTCLPYVLRVDPNFCSDAFEDNDSESSASKLTRPAQAASNAPLNVSASASEGDMDFYQFVTPKADPVSIRGSVTAAESATVQLRRIVTNTAGLGSIDSAGARVGVSETFSSWLLSNTAGALFRAQISATGSGCATYQLAFDVAACTDDFEDNDVVASAASIPFGSDISATVFRADDDYFDLSGLTAGGTCSVSYTLSDASARPLSLVVYNGSAGTLANTTSNTQITSGLQNASVHWSGAATVLAVSASSVDACQPYTLRCSATTPQ